MRVGTFIALVGVLSWPAAGWPQAARPTRPEVPAPYLRTKNQPGHDLVNTEQFVVPVGTVVGIEGLEFQAADCTFTPRQETIVRQVFNSIEEITENTNGDTDVARVAEFKKMEFEIRGYSNVTKARARNRTLGERCARLVMDTLTELGTPGWRLSVKALDPPKPRKVLYSSAPPLAATRVDFLRTR